jgi:hypothetical protein
MSAKIWKFPEVTNASAIKSKKRRRKIASRMARNVGWRKDPGLRMLANISSEESLIRTRYNFT